MGANWAAFQYFMKLIHRTVKILGIRTRRGLLHHFPIFWHFGDLVEFNRGIAVELGWKCPFQAFCAISRGFTVCRPASNLLAQKAESGGKPEIPNGVGSSAPAPERPSSQGSFARGRKTWGAGGGWAARSRVRCKPVFFWPKVSFLWERGSFLVFMAFWIKNFSWILPPILEVKFRCNLKGILMKNHPFARKKWRKWHLRLGFHIKMEFDFLYVQNGILCFKPGLPLRTS